MLFLDETNQIFLIESKVLNVSIEKFPTQSLDLISIDINILIYLKIPHERIGVKK